MADEDVGPGAEMAGAARRGLADAVGGGGDAGDATSGLERRGHRASSRVTVTRMPNSRGARNTPIRALTGTPIAPVAASPRDVPSDTASDRISPPSRRHHGRGGCAELALAPLPSDVRTSHREARRPSPR